MPTHEIDHHTYEELRQASGAGFIAELVDIFLADAPERIAELKSALMRGDADTFRRAAHTLKSTGATFGARRLSEMALELEVMGKEKRLDEESAKINELEAVYEKVAQELQDLQQ